MLGMWYTPLIEFSCNIGWSEMIAKHHSVDCANTIDLSLWTRNQNNSVIRKTLVFSCAQNPRSFSDLRDHHSTQRVSRRTTHFETESNEALLAFEAFDGQLPAVFTGHRSLHRFQHRVG